MSTNTFKSIGAVFAGLVAALVLSLETDFVLETTGALPKGPLHDVRQGLIEPGLPQRLYGAWKLHRSQTGTESPDETCARAGRGGLRCEHSWRSRYVEYEPGTGLVHIGAHRARVAMRVVGRQAAMKPRGEKILICVPQVGESYNYPKATSRAQKPSVFDIPQPCLAFLLRKPLIPGSEKERRDDTQRSNY